MSHQWKLCESCIQRHCNKRPVQKKGQTFMAEWTCPKYKQHQTGFKLEEVYHDKQRQS